MALVEDDQKIREIQREYLDFLDDEVIRLSSCITLGCLAASSPLFHFSNQLFLSQQVAKPTRNANILDLIFSPNDLINSIDICDTFISYRILTAETNIPMSPPLLSPKLNPANNVFEKLDFNKANWANLISAIKQIDWSTVLDPTGSQPLLQLVSSPSHSHKRYKEDQKSFCFLSRTEDLNEKEDQTKKEGSYKSFHFL